MQLPGDEVVKCEGHLPLAERAAFIAPFAALSALRGWTPGCHLITHTHQCTEAGAGDAGIGAKR
ncbi:MAG: hypothetical protein V2J89_04845 [Halieaceae bacterium]|jgi:hypothetical protein|nr:hypothetical protein [Halieaceae bacterium]